MSRDSLRFPEWARHDPADAALSGLRSRVRAPDLTGAILSRVNEQQPFLKKSGRRWRLAWLGAGALTLALAATAAVTVGRSAARAVPGVAPLEPLAEVVTCAVDEASRSVRTLAVSGRSLLIELTPAATGNSPTAAGSSAVRVQAVGGRDVSVAVGRTAQALRPLVFADETTAPAGVVLPLPRIDARLVEAVSATTVRLPAIRLSFGRTGEPMDLGGSMPVDLADEIASKLGAGFGGPSAGGGGAGAAAAPR